MRTGRHPLTAAVVALLLALPLVPRAASADSTTAMIVTATAEALDVDPLPVALSERLEQLLERFSTADVHSPTVLDAIADDDAGLGSVLAAHLAQERLRWSAVASVWERARAALGDVPGDCPLDDDGSCGLFQRLRLQTEAGLRLAGDGTCDEECAQRLERLRERIERTMRELERLGPDASDADVAEALEEAEQARARLQERIRVARGEAPGPGPGPVADADLDRDRERDRLRTPGTEGADA